jgi:hypothetical protein
MIVPRKTCSRRSKPGIQRGLPTLYNDTGAHVAPTALADAAAPAADAENAGCTARLPEKPPAGLERGTCIDAEFDSASAIIRMRIRTARAIATCGPATGTWATAIANNAVTPSRIVRT